MKTRKPKPIVLAVLIASLAGSGPLSADDSATVWQYEMGLGGKRPAGTFYLSYRTTNSGYVSISEPGRSSSLRIPLYSTDPKLPSVANGFSLLMRIDDDDTADGNGQSFKKTLGGLIGAIVVLGPPVVGMVKTIKQLDCIPYCPD